MRIKVVFRNPSPTWFLKVATSIRTQAHSQKNVHNNGSATQEMVFSLARYLVRSPVRSTDIVCCSVSSFIRNNMVCQKRIHLQFVQRNKASMSKAVNRGHAPWLLLRNILRQIFTSTIAGTIMNRQKKQASIISRNSDLIEYWLTTTRPVIEDSCIWHHWLVRSEKRFVSATATCQMPIPTILHSYKRLANACKER